MNIFLSILLIFGSVVYLGIAVIVFRCVYYANEDLKQRRHYNKHPERYGVEPVWSIAIISILWPLQVLGLLIYICGLYKRW